MCLFKSQVRASSQPATSCTWVAFSLTRSLAMSYRCSLGHPAADWSWHIRVIACRYGHRQHHWSTFLHKNLSYFLLRIPRMSSRHRIPSYKTVWHHGYSPQLPCEMSHCSHRSTDSLPIRTPSAKFPPQLPPQLPHLYSGLYDTEEEFYHKKIIASLHVFAMFHFHAPSPPLAPLHTSLRLII